MQPAADEMATALATATMVWPRPCRGRQRHRPSRSPTRKIRRLLVEQVTGRVRWRESMMWMAGLSSEGGGGVTRFAEIGSGKVLTGMAKRIAPDADAVALNTPEELEAFAKSL
jgi:[acyl-carrier-protein] S-malonyltransferase